MSIPQRMGFSLNPERRRLFASQIAAVRPSARELYLQLRERRLQSRPVIGHDTSGAPILGPSTYRNVIEDGELR